MAGKHEFKVLVEKPNFTILVRKYDFENLARKFDFAILAKKHNFVIFARKYIFTFFTDKFILWHENKIVCVNLFIRFWGEICFMVLAKNLFGEKTQLISLKILFF